MTNIAFIRKRNLFAVFLALMGLAIAWCVLLSPVPLDSRPTASHPQFGPVYVAEMSELLHDVNTPNPHRDKALQVGPALLGWSIRNNILLWRSGYIYMNDSWSWRPSVPVWEFALSRKKRLAEVTRDDLHCDYYGANDPRGASVYGTAWLKEAICVPQGQIFFARLVTNQSVTYVIRLAKQRGTDRGGTMRIEYVVAGE